MKNLFLLLIAMATTLQVHAQGRGDTVSTTLQSMAMNAKSAHLRSQANHLVALIEAKKFAEADQKALALRKSYEATFDPGLKQFTFHTQAEFEEFSKSSAVKFEWIDFGYAQCLKMQAYLAAERRDFPAALAFLQSVDAVAPISADSALEVGYVLNQSGKPEAGLIVYRRAHALAEKYPSQRPYRAAALRGIGYALIDLKRLDEAERAFQESLKIEPGNKVALNELAYIKAERGAR
jgi:tetratricopeptide (TPR) repeat protein